MKESARIFAVSLLSAFVVATAGATTFPVATTVDSPDTSPGDGNCISVAGPCSLRAAIQEANSHSGDDAITVPAGTYVLSIAGVNENAAATGDLDVQENLSITGAGAESTIIDANQIDRVFDVLGGSLTLTGLTITGGNATTTNSFEGGGIKGSGTLLSVNACELTGNVANMGGAIFGSGPVHIVSSLLSGNSTEDSGFTNAFGTAVRAEGGLTLDSSTVTDNSGPLTYVYAIDAQCGSVTETVDIENSTVSKNQGSGISTYNCAASLLNVTVADNTSRGITLGSYTGNDVRTVTNTISAHNNVDCLIPAGPNLIFDHCLDTDNSCGLSAPAGDLPATDPLLLPLHDWGGPTPTQYPNPVSSPVIDAGLGSVCPALDQRGQARGGDGNGDGIAGCDIGAVEATDLIFYDGFEDGTANAW